MPDLVVEKTARALNDARKPVRGSRILVLGVAYKRDVDDTRESPALDVIRLLEERGADVVYHDPHVARFQEDGKERRSIPLSDVELARADAVVIVTDHSGVDYQRLVDRAAIVVDTRNALARLRPSKARVVSLTPRAAAPSDT
jgi:UDP-N-acetyl-D-glucosamine dehydrogenase